MLGFDYFTLLDHLTIARSRRIEVLRHQQRPAADTTAAYQHQGRRRPCGRIRAIRDINPGNSMFHAHSVTRHAMLLPQSRRPTTPNTLYQVRGGESFFRQVDREGKPDSAARERAQTHGSCIGLH